MYIDKVNDKIGKDNNTYHSKIKMKSVDLKSSTYIDSSKEVNDEDPKFKIGDIVRISKYKNIFVKSSFSNWSEELFVIKKIKNTVPWTYVLRDLNGKKNCQNLLRKRIAKSKSKRVWSWNSNREKRW